MDIANRLLELAHQTVRPGQPGLAIGIYTDGELAQHATAGLASVEFDAPVTTHTRFDIASVSKHFTATAALLLCRDGKLSLDDDIRVHLPELNLQVPVTVAQSLRHTGGLRDWLALTELAGRPLTRMTQKQTLAFVAGVTGLDFEPGKQFSYSNTGYVLVASLVERLTGMTLGEFTTERMFIPLGMSETLFREDSQLPLLRFANGYDVGEAGMRRADTEECAVGDGGLATSLADLAPWFGFLLDGRVLGADLRDGLLERVNDIGGGPRSYALGLSHTSVCGEPAFGHAGGVPGYRSQLLFLPRCGIGVAVLTNNSSIAPRPVAAEALRLAAGLVAEEPAERVDRTAATAGLTGYWMDPKTDRTMRVETTRGGLLKLSGEITSAELALTVDGTWHGQGASADSRLQVTGDGLRLGSVNRPGDDALYRRCDPPVIGATLPTAVYRSSELGVLATVTAKGELELGLQMVTQIKPAPDGAFTAGGLTLRLDGDHLLISTPGVYRMPFARQPDGTVPLGVPSGFNVAS
ncbi:serine hydrolase [Arthrobacter sp. 18067]|uniref:serine hydrolase domain-containing protein n=1 Tax=Arthrobacter sp. 18067 TaxID=2681413 RepID=UPI0013591232|nr:serine hydrolase domain-containing protein [Arthrobacter sp. 18067]